MPTEGFGLVIGFAGWALFLVLIMTGMQIGWSAAIVGILGLALLASPGAALQTLAYFPYNTFANESWSVMPVFIIMGYLAGVAGIMDDIFITLQSFFGGFRGGLLITTTFAAAGFGACTGSSTAAAALLASVAHPMLTRYGYDPKLSAACIASSGTMASMIPPSALMVVYGILTDQSIGALLIAGILPGLLEAVSYSFAATIGIRIWPGSISTPPRLPLKQRIFELRRLWSFIIVALCVIGGIYGGFATPTEAGALGAFAALVIALVRKRLTWPSLKKMILESVQLTVMLFIVLLGTILFMRFTAMSGIVDPAINWISASGFSTVVIVIIMMIIYAILGCFLTPTGMLMLTIPLFLPILQHVNINYIWFGVLCVRMGELGLITPPVGLNVFAVQNVTKVPAMAIFKACSLYMAFDVMNVALLVAFPQISLFLPSMIRRIG